MFEILNYEFVQNALIAGILVSIAAGVIGSLVVTNKMVFLAGGIAHSAYGGIGLSIFFGFSIFFGASVFAIAAAFLMAYLTYDKKTRADTVIGVIWALGMALGIVFIDMTPGYNVDLMSYLFGSILAVQKEDLYFMFFLDLAIILVVTVFYRAFLAISYDMEFSKLRGLPVKFFYFLLLGLTALTVVTAIRVVGLILVIAILTIPTYISEQISSSFAKMMVNSSIISVIFVTVGLLIAYRFDITSGAAIILFASVVFIVFFAYQKLKNNKIFTK